MDRVANHIFGEQLMHIIETIKLFKNILMFCCSISTWSLCYINALRSLEETLMKSTGITEYKDWETLQFSPGL